MIAPVSIVHSSVGLKLRVWTKSLQSNRRSLFVCWSESLCIAIETSPGTDLLPGRHPKTNVYHLSRLKSNLYTISVSIAVRGEQQYLAVHKQNCLENRCYVCCFNSFFKVTIPLKFLYNIEVLLLKEQEVLKGYWYFIYMKCQQLMKNLKWIRNSGFLSILNRFLAISVFHICFLLANASCCCQCCRNTEENCAHVYLHRLPQTGGVWSSFSGRKKKMGFASTSRGSEKFIQ